METHSLQDVLRAEALDERAQFLMLSAKKETTRTSYLSALKVFDAFWLASGEVGSPFPVSHASELRFVAWLSRDHPVQSSTAAQYLSAVRSHSMVSFAPTSAAHVSLAVKGMALLQSAVKPVGLAPTWPAEAVVVAARLLLSALGKSRPDFMECQALVSSIVGFLFLSRAATLCSVRPSDFTVVNRTLLFCESHRKSKLVPQPRSLQFLLESGSPAWAVAVYGQVVGLKYPDLMDRSLVSLFTQSSPAARVEACLRTVVRLIGDNVTVILPTSSHCLRRGGAVSMLAVGVPLTKICEWGHWAGEPSVRPYVAGRAFQCPSPADKLCFSWLAVANRSLLDESPSPLV